MVSHKSSDAIVSLLSPDGYYTYLNVPRGIPSKENPDETVVDEDLIKKNYRKLSLKHHPDKPGGDDETFRVLNRAQKVLTNPKLRKQYDILGIDLDDDEEHEQNDTDEDKESAPTTAQGIVQEIAGMVISFMLQLTVRTMMMGAVSVLLVRYRWTMYPALAFLAYIAFRIVQTSRLAGGSSTDVLSPLAIAIGLMLMHNSIRASWIFFWGESLVIFMFTYNSYTLTKNSLIYAGMALASMLAALWFRGSFWNYVTVVVIEAVLALLTALAFPVMELVLDAILNEKLKKVGIKVRHHHAILEKHYQSKMDEAKD